MEYPNTTEVTSRLPIRHSVVTVSSLSIFVNFAVTVACLKKQIQKSSPFNLLLISILIAEIVIGVDVLVVVHVDIRNYYQASATKRILMCMLTQKAATRAAGTIFLSHLVYMSFLRASVFEAANSHIQLSLRNKKVIRFIVVMWVVSLLFGYCGFAWANDIDQESKLCKSAAMDFGNVQNLYKFLIFALFVSWLVYVMILIINFIRAASYFCKQQQFEQSTINQHKIRILTILIGQSLSYILASAPLLTTVMMTTVRSIRLGTAIPEKALEMFSMVDPVNIPCLVALLHCLIDPLVIAYTVFGKICNSEPNSHRT